VHGVFAMTADASLNVVCAGGEFTTIDGLSQRRLALFG
jgi:hypothetical protein